jgi:hypothetical protein
MTTKINTFNIDTDTIVTVGTLTSLEIEGSLYAGSANLGNLVVGNYFQGDGHLLSNITVSTIAASNITGQVSNALVAGTVYTNAQPNITSTGTLTSLTVSGVTTFGAVGNVKITGGTSGQYLSTDGAGNLSFQTVTVPDPLHPFLLGGM